jgi:hypothetical protein
MTPSINTPYPLDQESPEDVALDFYALLAYFERALLKAGFRTGGPQHSRGLPDWEGFARSIAPRFAQVTEPNAVGSAAILLGISVRTLEDVGGDNPADRRFYQSDMVWIARVIRTAGRRLAHAETLPWRRPNSQLLLRSCVMVMQAWAKCDPGVRQHLKELWALDDQAVALHFVI